MSEMLHFGRRDDGERVQSGQGFRRQGMVIRSDREGTASFMSGPGRAPAGAGSRTRSPRG